MFFFLSLLNVQEYGLWYNERQDDSEQILERNLILSDVLIADSNQDASVILRPVFDVIWQACGYSNSFNYDDSGNWTGGR